MKTMEIYDQLIRLERHMRSTKNLKLKGYMANEYRRLMEALDCQKIKEASDEDDRLGRGLIKYPKTSGDEDEGTKI